MIDRLLQLIVLRFEQSHEVLVFDERLPVEESVQNSFTFAQLGLALRNRSLQRRNRTTPRLSPLRQLAFAFLQMTLDASLFVWGEDSFFQYSVTYLAKCLGARF
tara:strand:- start:854 stop:1165 length:312 start_codon:yes stop_codon:yes gene_type:complete